MPSSFVVLLPSSTTPLTLGLSDTLRHSTIAPSETAMSSSNNSHATEPRFCLKSEFPAAPNVEAQSRNEDRLRKSFAAERKSSARWRDVAKSGARL